MPNTFVALFCVSIHQAGILGVSQVEGLHCDDNDCTIENLWWGDVSEDALCIKGGNASSVLRILRGGPLRGRQADLRWIRHARLRQVVSLLWLVQETPAQRFLNMSNVYADLEVIKAQHRERDCFRVQISGAMTRGKRSL
ncbi:hypothetical protein PR003_g8669 [Phytophthora rubi]|uniref:Probable pectate lyase F n=1 Tax=Phytophthora rubi TaxID=129364 RepID=A0A6A4FGD3_9STRA|nr:hypothetical protein PR002_g13738 [Phytophthora rubi]KAE9038401.1 hypothetical protein PR001_g7956 [Phytophthora rubi]KAE9344020.1 hypothetical protein PR003_g8669 [Phytophthora rubi]